MTSQVEQFTANYTSDFQLYAQEDFGFSQLPPLTHKFGKIKKKSNVETLLQSAINGVAFENPILSFLKTTRIELCFYLVKTFGNGG